MIDWDTWWLLVQFVVGFDVLIVFVALYTLWWRRRGKIEVRCKTPYGEKKKWLKPEKDGETMIFEKEKKDVSLGWSFKFTSGCLIPVRNWRGARHDALDVKYNAPSAVDWSKKAEEIEVPIWDRKTFEDIAIKHGMKMLPRMIKMVMPTVIWGVLVLQFVTIILLVLLHTGVVRFGA